MTVKLCSRILNIFNIKGKTLQLVATLTGALGAVSCGMHDAWPSATLPQLLHSNSTIVTSNEQGSWIAVMPLLGGIVGALLGMVMIDKAGRKTTVLSTFIPSFVGWILLAISGSVTLIMIARCIAGISGGLLFSTLPIYIAEISDPSIRGLLGSVTIIAWTFGALLINVVGPYFSITVTALISAVVPVLMLITFSCMPESPYFYLLRENYHEAESSVKAFTGRDNVQEELIDLTTTIKKQFENSGTFCDLVTVKSYRKALLIAVTLRCFQQFSGHAPISFYITHVFQESDGYFSAYISTIMFYTVHSLLCIITSLFLDNLGRKPILIVSSFGVACALFVEGTYFYLKDSSTNFDTNNFSFFSITCLIIFIVFDIGLEIIPTVISAELFPPNVKAFAMCVCDIVFNLVGVLASKVFQLLKDDFGMCYPFYSFAVITIFGMFFYIIFVSETKKKTLGEIQDDLKS